MNKNEPMRPNKQEEKCEVEIPRRGGIERKQKRMAKQTVKDLIITHEKNTVKLRQKATYKKKRFIWTYSSEGVESTMVEPLEA